MRLTMEDSAAVLSLRPRELEVATLVIDDAGSQDWLDDRSCTVVFGATAVDLAHLRVRIQEAAHGMELTLPQLHALLSILLSIPAMYGSEEYFHTRVGCYREEAARLALAMLSQLRSPSILPT